jgi:ribosomal-protein-alanine N-acetyltransferase
MATSVVQLRSGDARDVGAVDAIMAAAFDPRYGEAWTRNQCVGVMAMPGVAVTLALVDDRPAGFAMTRTVLDETELLLLAVDPARRRRGIGASLLRAVRADCALAGVRALHLEVRDGNPAVALYTGQGFTKVGERRGYYKGPGGRDFDAHTYMMKIG